MIWLSFKVIIRQKMGFWILLQLPDAPRVPLLNRRRRWLILPRQRVADRHRLVMEIYRRVWAKPLKSKKRLMRSVIPLPIWSDVPGGPVEDRPKERHQWWRYCPDCKWIHRPLGQPHCWSLSHLEFNWISHYYNNLYHIPTGVIND